MDSTSIPALCLTTSKLLVGLHQYLSDISDVPRHVEELTTELSIFNLVLIQLKTLVVSKEDSQRDLLKKWAVDSSIMLKGCQETLQRVEELASKSKIKTRESIKGQVIKYTTWNWRLDDTVSVRESLEKYKSCISLMLDYLNDDQLDNPMEAVDRLHKKVLHLKENRKESAEPVRQSIRISHSGLRTSYNRSSKSQDAPIPVPPPQLEVPTFRPPNANLFRDLKTKSWKVTVSNYNYRSVWETAYSFKCQMKIVIRDGKIPGLEMTLSQDTISFFKDLYDKHFENFMKNRALDTKRNNTKEAESPPTGAALMIPAGGDIWSVSTYLGDLSRDTTLSERGKILGGYLDDTGLLSTPWTMDELRVIAKGFQTLSSQPQDMNALTSTQSKIDQGRLVSSDFGRLPSSLKLLTDSPCDSTTTSCSPSPNFSEVRTNLTQTTSEPPSTAYHASWEPGPFPLYFRTFQTGKIFFEFGFQDIYMHNRMRYIDIHPGKDSCPHRKAQERMRLQFDIYEDLQVVDEVCKLLKQVKEESEASWKLQARTFANLSEGGAGNNPRVKKKAWKAIAAEEEYKWSMFLRACLDGRVEA